MHAGTLLFRPEPLDVKRLADAIRAVPGEWDEYTPERFAEVIFDRLGDKG